MNNGPPPSHLTLLSNLGNFLPGDKVRFLGCVTSYSVKTANLILEHPYPSGSGLKAAVDVTLVLNTLKSDETRVGEWLNIIGYVKVSGTQKFDKNVALVVNIQAIVVWPSGPFRLQTYEQSLEEQGKG